MNNTQNTLLSIKKVVYQIFGYQTLIFDGTFKETTSIYPIYYAFVAFLFVVADIIHVVQSEFKYDKTHAITHQVTTVAFILVSASCVVLSIVSESFIYIKEKLQVQNKFLEIHKMLLSKPFVESDFLVFTRTQSIFFIVIIALQAANTIALWGRFCYGTYVAIRSMVIAMTLLEILTEIYTCKYFVALLNQSLVSQYSHKIKEQNTTDFQETKLFPKIARDDEILDELLSKNCSEIIDYTKIYDMLNDNAKLISLRFAFTVNLNKRTF